MDKLSEAKQTKELERLGHRVDTNLNMARELFNQTSNLVDRLLGPAAQQVGEAQTRPDPMGCFPSMSQNLDEATELIRLSLENLQRI